MRLPKTNQVFFHELMWNFRRIWRSIRNFWRNLQKFMSYLWTSSRSTRRTPFFIELIRETIPWWSDNWWKKDGGGLTTTRPKSHTPKISSTSSGPSWREPNFSWLPRLFRSRSTTSRTSTSATTRARRPQRRESFCTRWRREERTIILRTTGCWATESPS